MAPVTFAPSGMTMPSAEVWSFLLKNHVFLISTYPFTRHHSLQTPAVNKMPSFCAMAKEYNIFSFELHMFNPCWNGDVFNQRFVSYPRTGVLHTCHQKDKIWPPLHQEKKGFCSGFAKRTTILVWLYGRLNRRLNYIAKFQPYFNWHPPSVLPKLTLPPPPEDLKIVFTTPCCTCGDEQLWHGIPMFCIEISIFPK